MFGRMLNETLGKIHFWGTVIPFNVIFIPLFITGTAGDQRRVYNYAQFAEQSRPALQHLRTTSTIALLVMLSFQLVFIFNFFWSLRNGKSAGRESMAIRDARMDGSLAAAARKFCRNADGVSRPL